MNTVVVKGKDSYFFGARASIVDETKELANASWASEHIVSNKALGWILGKFVEADNPNNNKQLWTLADLQMTHPTVHYAPMNVNHMPGKVVGAYVATDLLYPNDEAGEGYTNPYVEALSVFWKVYNPEAYSIVERAHEDGSLFYSMECVAETLTFRDGDLEETFPYKGPFHPSYGEWNQSSAIRQLDNPHFIGGALIVPPVKPGWSNADITTISKYMEQHNEETHAIYSDVASQADHLDPKQIEAITMELISRGLNLDDQNSIKNVDTPNNTVAEELTANTSPNEPQELEGGADMAESYTEAELKAKVDEATAEMRAELDSFKAKADADAVDAKVATVKAEYDEKVEALQKDLDTAVLEAQAAKAEKDETLSYLADLAAAETAEAEKAARRDERLAKVKEVASFPDEYVDANADRWVELSEESFASLLEDYATVSKAAKETSTDHEGVSDEALAATAMKAAAGKPEDAAAARRKVLGFRNMGIDPRTV